MAASKRLARVQMGQAHHVTLQFPQKQFYRPSGIPRGSGTSNNLKSVEANHCHSHLMPLTHNSSSGPLSSRRASK